MSKRLSRLTIELRATQCALLLLLLAWISARNPDELRAKRFVLLDSDGVHVRSAAVLRILRGLGSWFLLLRLGVVLPRPIRDAIYDMVARNRYRWFGRRDVCMTPTPDIAARFLDADEPRAATDA